MILDATTKSLEAFLGAAITTSQPTYSIDYVDITPTTFSPGNTSGAFNSTTDVTILAAPLGLTQRQVKCITIYNADTVVATVTVQLDTGGTERALVKYSLPSLRTLMWTPDQGWFVPFTTPDIGTLNTVFTVAGLPAGAQGMRAFVSDANAPAFGAAVAGGGAVFIPVYYTGAAWFVG